MIAPDTVVVVIQARMSSTRLPGKVLAPLAGRPAILRLVERVRRIRRASRHVVATSEDRSDDPLALTCAEHGVPCVRGSLNDVLGRVVTAIPDGCEVVVRLTGDCPLMDPALVDHHIARYEAAGSGVSYVTNAVSRTYPDGLDVEVVSRGILEEADRMATAPSDREHVTPWVQRHSAMVAVTQQVDLSALRWVLDTPSDYEALSGVYDALYPATPGFDSTAVYRLLLQRPDLIRVAGGVSVEEQMERVRGLMAGELTP
jgi:spore coat polysaccharide biosynthesis protein SpsF